MNNVQERKLNFFQPPKTHKPGLTLMHIPDSTKKVFFERFFLKWIGKKISKK
jgi:hypothetical protein